MFISRFDRKYYFIIIYCYYPSSIWIFHIKSVYSVAKLFVLSIINVEPILKILLFIDCLFNKIMCKWKTTKNTCTDDITNDCTCKIWATIKMRTVFPEDPGGQVYLNRSSRRSSMKVKRENKICYFLVKVNRIKNARLILK